jgi:hypothetical protein
MSLILRELKGVDQAALTMGWAKHHLKLLGVEILAYLNRPMGENGYQSICDTI